MEHVDRVRDPELEVELEVEDYLELDVVDDLDDPWFALGESGPAAEVYEIDPVHPLRRLSAWVRGRLAA